MKTALVFEAVREGYAIDQLRNPVTVGELRELLDGLEDDTVIVLSHDSGYIFGSLSRGARFCEEWPDEEGGDIGGYVVMDEYRL